MAELTLEYAGVRKGTGVGWVYLMDVAAMFLVWSLAVILFAIVFPHQREMCKDFKVPLPAIMEFMLTFADWFANEWGFVVMFGLILVAPLPRMIFRIATDKRGVRDAIRGTVIWLILWVAFLGGMEALFMGMFWTLMGRASGGV